MISCADVMTSRNLMFLGHQPSPLSEKPQVTMVKLVSNPIADLEHYLYMYIFRQMKKEQR